MATPGAYICYKNDNDTATLAGVDNMTVDGNYPYSNTQKRGLGQFMKFSVTGSLPAIRIDRGASKAGMAFSAVVLAGITGSTGTFNYDFCTVQVSTNGTTWTNASALTTTYESGTPSDDGFLPRLYLCFFDTPLTQRYVKITLNSHPTSDIVQIGRIWIGNAIKIDGGVEQGWTMGFIDESKLDASVGAQFYEDKRVRRRRLSFNVPVIELPELIFGVSGNDYAHFQEMQMWAGISGDVIIAPKVSDQRQLRRCTIYGHIAEAFDINCLVGGYYSVALTIEEER